MTELFEDGERWPGAPPICLAANLPAFATHRQMMEFHEHNGQGNLIIHQWRCRACAHWHYWSAGQTNSSGNSVSQSHAIELAEKLFGSPVADTFS